MNNYSGKKLSEVPFSDIYIGMPVISAVGTLGKVVTTVSPGSRDEDNDIVISWDNGNKSIAWHFWMDKVMVV